MKIKIYFFLIISILVLGDITAQNRNNRFALTTKLNLLDNLTPIDNFTLFNDENFSETTQGGEIGFMRNINKFVNIGIPLRMGRSDIRPNGIPDEILRRLNISLDLVGQIGYFPKDYLISPYIMGGVGYQLETATNNNKSTIAFPVGAGLNFRVHRNVYLQIQTEYRFTTTSLPNRDQIVYGAGIIFPLIGLGDKKPPKDSDMDGIPDKDDKCPLLKGTTRFKGCPDTDGDKISDRVDDCPEVPGIRKFKGCPDTDEDGIMDSLDNCPTEAGLEKFDGCPDSDNDGTIDKDDKCPNLVGPIELKGCPDADGDGVADIEDDCPSEVGTIPNKGCPEIAVVIDTDNDGVPDDEDRCPDNAGTLANKGCPEITVEDKEVLNLAVSNIEFETARATLKTSSFVRLEEVVGLMQKYPEYSLSINGHTDSVGSSKTNQILSERRAKSCYDYLIKKGISASRMNYVGYGETQPIADNRFKDGRETNRRVEFLLYVK
jgi:Outer membrane protein and related peptidoglycan-associated (lipo)proteins